MENYLLFRRKNILFWIFIPVLYLFSLIYNFLISLIQFAHRRNIFYNYKSRLKVISVGNITLGGSGKTPLVEWLIEYLQIKGKEIGVIMRGYKRPDASRSGVIKDTSSYYEIGDEASMLQEKFKSIKIGIGRNKISSARLLEGENCDVLILDDGFQHWRLKRDLDIVAIDASLPLTNQKLLPLGILREPLSSLKRADILCLTKVDMSLENYIRNKELLSSINPKALIVSSVYEPVCFCNLKTDSCARLDSGKSVLIVCGIANTLYFENMVSKLQLKIVKKLAYPDHYEYKKDDLGLIKKIAKDNGVDTIITTHKDAVRLKPLLEALGDVNIFFLQIKLKITENEEALRNRLLSVFSG